MRFFVLVLMYSSLYANEFVIKKTIKNKRESRSVLREKIVRSSANILDGSCICIREQTKKLAQQQNDISAIQKILNIIADLQQELLAMTRELLEQDNRWIQASRKELDKIAYICNELAQDIIQEHDSAWWDKNFLQLKKSLPKKR